MVDARLKLNPTSLAWSAEDGEVVALDLNETRYVGVNHSGALLWDRLAHGTTRAELVELLAGEYGLEPADVEHDVDAFVRACHEHGYLE